MTPHGLPQKWYFGPPTRRLRLGSGLVLFAYVATHLVNHALCNASMAAADAMLLIQKWIWQSVPGTVALYGALLVHVLLGLQALYARRHFRWTRAEAMQLGFGLAVPALVANHIAVTRTALALYGLNKGYVAELASLWVASPALGWLQVAVLVAAWTHGCIGLFFLLRLRRGFATYAPLLLAAAVLLPVLALLGFVQGGREVARALAQPGFRAAHLGPAVVGTPEQVAELAWLRDRFLLLYVAAVALVIAARGIRRLLEWRRGLITVSYAGAGTVRMAPGHSVLDASRMGGIPHASVCGGRGRCSTCRIRILSSAGPLTPPSAHERQMLTGIGADTAQVRLACQLHPTADVQVFPLIPARLALQFVAGRAMRIPEEERFVAAMFIDLRGSTVMMANRTPFDSVFLLGRFIDSVTRAVLDAGGRPVQFLGDGVLALFGLESPPEQACRQALAAVDGISAALHALRGLFAQETGHDLRFGIGLHCGRAIVGEIGLSDHVAFTALGDIVNMASRLQELARDLGAAAAVSDDVFACANADPSRYRAVDSVPRGAARPMRVRTMNAVLETA
jgi:adenylate cyclase